MIMQARYGNVYVFTSPFEKGGEQSEGAEGDLFKKSPLTPLFQSGELNSYISACVQAPSFDFQLSGWIGKASI